MFNKKKFINKNVFLGQLDSLGQFANVRSSLVKNRGSGVFEGGWYPNTHYVADIVLFPPTSVGLWLFQHSQSTSLKLK